MQRNQFRPRFKEKQEKLHPQQVDLANGRQRVLQAPSRRPTNKAPKRQYKTEKKAVPKKKRLPKRATPTGTGEPRALTRSTRYDHTLRKTYFVKTLTVGCIEANVRRVPGITAPEATLISNRLQSCVSILNEMRVRAYEIIALDIARILGPRYSVLRDETIGPGTQPGATAQPAPPLGPLSNQDLSDLQDILENPTFYAEMATLLADGQLGPGSQYMRNLAAAGQTRTISTRHTPAETPRSMPPVPHAVRAYGLYREKTNLTALGREAGIRSTVPRLAMRAVMHAMRMHYMGSVFSVEDERPDGRNDIDFFFEKNSETGMFSDFPMSKLRPTHVYLSETDLVHILYGDATTRAITARVLTPAGQTPFGVTAAEKAVVETKGILIQKLLYPVGDPRRLNGYHKKLSMQQRQAGIPPAT
ncbi:hypothetical protein EDD11_000199, partial [Mortierella claussenii]